MLHLFEHHRRVSAHDWLSVRTCFVVYLAATSADDISPTREVTHSLNLCTILARYRDSALLICTIVFGLRTIYIRSAKYPLVKWRSKYQCLMFFSFYYSCKWSCIYILVHRYVKSHFVALHRVFSLKIHLKVRHTFTWSSLRERHFVVIFLQSRLFRNLRQQSLKAYVLF